MQKLLREYLDERNTKRRKNLRAGVAMLLLAVMVIGCVAGALSQYGFAVTGNAKCGKEEHQHTAECYEKKLICSREEDPGHIHSEECLPLICTDEDPEHVHTAECRDANGAYICGEEEREAHFHSDECYEEVLTCEKEEHIHTDMCYNDADADVETEDVWANQYAEVQWTGIWGEDLVLAAQVQLGYRESIENFTAAEDGSHKGYTRYGAFVNEPYCNWDAAFVSFCLHYAGIQNRDTETLVFPKTTDTAKWQEEFEKLREGNGAFFTGPEEYVPAAGDLIFFQRENEETAVQMGIVASFDQEKNEIHVIEGNSQNEVKENIYPSGEEHIVRFLKLAEVEAAYRAEQEAGEQQNPEAPTQPAESEEPGKIFTTEDPEGNGDQAETEEATVELTTEVDGTTITLSGPQSSFEEGKEYSIQATKVEDEQVIATIEEAIAPLEDPNAAPIATAEKAETKAQEEEPAEAPAETGAPEGAPTEAPEETTAAPEETPAAEPEETTAPTTEEPTTAPAETTGAAEEPTTAPEEAAAPEEPQAIVEDSTEAPTAEGEETEQPTKQIKSYQAFDIKLMADGEEVQPLGPVSVKFSSPEMTESVEDEATEVKVIHVDENTGAATDMEAAATEEKDVVIETDHFSVYVYVEVTMDPIGGVAINIQHWVTNLTLVDSTVSNENRNVIDQGFKIEYTDEEKHTGPTKAYVVQKSPETTACKLYSTDTGFRLPNETYMNVAKLSKVCNVPQGETARYKIKEVWVSNEKQSDKYSENTKEWEEGTYTKYTEAEIASEEVIQERLIKNLQDDFVIRFWYEPIQKKDRRDPVTFYDYDISTGVKGENQLYTDRKGINADVNYANPANPANPADPANDVNKLGLGQPSSGNASSWADTAKLGIFYLNKGNQYLKSDGSVWHPEYKGTNMLVKGIVNSTLLENGKVAFNVNAPTNLFNANPKNDDGTDDGDGSTRYDGYKLEFSQLGDTYTLKNVYDETGKLTNANNLTTFRTMKGYSVYAVAANEFWPLDGVKATDPLMGEKLYTIADARKETAEEIGRGAGNGFNDFVTENGHNWYFGMEYQVNFTVGDYTGPLEYYFRGDDDFWLFLDGEQVVDIGGIHPAVGECFDLRAYMEEKVTSGNMTREALDAWYENEHSFKVFYMERGATGSCCYMQFTLPRAQIVPVEQPDTMDYTVTKKWEDDNNAFRPDIKITLYKEKKIEGKTVSVPVREITLPLRDKDGNYVDAEGKPSNQPVWHYTWYKLPIYDGLNKLPITYRAEEEYLDANPMLGYKVEYSSDGTGATITNTLKDKKIKVKKVWVGDEAEIKNRPGSITFELYANGELYLDQTGQSKTVTVSAPDWEGTFHKVPEYYYNATYQDPETGKIGAWRPVEYSVKELPLSDQSSGMGAADSDESRSGEDSPAGAEMTGDEEMSDVEQMSNGGATADVLDEPVVKDVPNGTVELATASNPQLNPGEFLGKNGAIYKIDIKKNVLTDDEKAAGYIASFTATNTLVTKNICIEKVSKSNSGIDPLAGAEFTLYVYDKENGTPVSGITDTNSDTGELEPVPVRKVGDYATEEDGRVDIKSLRAGKKYYLVETKAPDGYFLLEKPVKIVVTEATKDEEGNVTGGIVTANFQIADWDKGGEHVKLEGESKWVIQIPNEVAYTLPSTGGLGIYWSTLCGVLLMAAASLIVYRNKRKEVL